jgi:type VI protein secretion system component Hcp
MPISSSSSSTTRTTGRVVMNDVKVSKLLDRSSVTLNSYVWSGRNVRTVKIQAFASGMDGGPPALQLEYELSDVIFTSFSTNAEGNTPVETITMSFSKIKATHYLPRSPGSPSRPTVAVGWDITANRALT